jgi:hypothetical protein
MEAGERKREKGERSVGQRAWSMAVGATLCGRPLSGDLAGLGQGGDWNDGNEAGTGRPEGRSLSEAEGRRPVQ